jgi:ABC-2 type transport system permease protein
MRHWLRKLRATLALQIALVATYRAEVVLWALSGTLPIIMMGLWAKAASDQPLALTPTQMVRYFAAVLLVRQMTFVWVIWELEQHVVQGTLSHALLRPFSPVWNFLAGHLGERLVRLPAVLLLIGLCFALYPEAAYVPSLPNLLLGALTIVAALLTRFVMQLASAMLCFYTERASNIESINFVAYMFLSGAIAPLEVFPPGVRAFAELLPFPYFVHLPARVLMGEEAPVLRGLCIMGAWALFFFVLQQIGWRRGLRRYSAHGA